MTRRETDRAGARRAPRPGRPGMGVPEAGRRGPDRRRLQAAAPGRRASRPCRSSSRRRRSRRSRRPTSPTPSPATNEPGRSGDAPGSRGGLLARGAGFSPARASSSMTGTADGVREAGEPGLAAVEVSNGVDVAVTDANGAYRLPDRPGAAGVRHQAAGLEPAGRRGPSCPHFYAEPDGAAPPTSRSALGGAGRAGPALDPDGSPALVAGGGGLPFHGLVDRTWTGCGARLRRHPRRHRL